MPQIILFGTTFTDSTSITPLDYCNNLLLFQTSLSPTWVLSQESGDFVKIQVKLVYFPAPATLVPCSNSDSAGILCSGPQHNSRTCLECSFPRYLHASLPDFLLVNVTITFSVRPSLNLLSKISALTPYNLIFLFCFTFFPLNTCHFKNTYFYFLHFLSECEGFLSILFTAVIPVPGTVSDKHKCSITTKWRNGWLISERK